MSAESGTLAVPGHWVAVASAEHVRLVRSQGFFMQVCHGKAAPLRRIRPDDRVVCYSPSTALRGKDRLQAFTAIGRVRQGEPYAFDMGGGFVPFRRHVDWLEATPAPIQPLLDRLAFCAGARNWGCQLRFGLLAISAADRDLISAALGASLAA